jgi:hypothetical protein
VGLRIDSSIIGKPLRPRRSAPPTSTGRHRRHPVGAASRYTLGIETGTPTPFRPPFQQGTKIDLATDGADVTVAGPYSGSRRRGRARTAVTGGDLNADGLDEWIVGAPFADGRASAYRILGHGVVGERRVGGPHAGRPARRTRRAAMPSVRHGRRRRDLVVASPSHDGSPIPDKIDSGAVYVVRGRAGAEVRASRAPTRTVMASTRRAGPAARSTATTARITTYPFAPELCNDGHDNNCDG